MGPAAGGAAAPGPGRRADDGGARRPRAVPVLRHTAVREPDAIVRHLPHTSARVHRRPVARRRFHWGPPPTQLHVTRERGVPRRPHVGEPDAAVTRGAGARPDVRDRSGRARPGRARAPRPGRARGLVDLPAAVRRGVPALVPASRARGVVERLVTTENVALALAAFPRSIVSFRSPYDRYRFHGDEAALRRQPGGEWRSSSRAAPGAEVAIWDTP